MGNPYLKIRYKIMFVMPILRGPAGLFRDAGFATFCDGISGNWVLKLRETGLDTPTVSIMNFLLGKREKYEMIA